MDEGDDGCLMGSGGIIGRAQKITSTKM